jgi:hypothetical protein
MLLHGHTLTHIIIIVTFKVLYYPGSYHWHAGYRHLLEMQTTMTTCSTIVLQRYLAVTGAEYVSGILHDAILELEMLCLWGILHWAALNSVMLQRSTTKLRTGCGLLLMQRVYVVHSHSESGRRRIKFGDQILIVPLFTTYLIHREV